eukprot:scaffold123288_cov50-Attheya_sp.AAC.1
MCQLLTLLLTAATATRFLFPCANAFIIATNYRQFRSTTFSLWSHVPGGEANPWLSADDGMERGFQAAFSTQPINNRDLQAIDHDFNVLDLECTFASSTTYEFDNEIAARNIIRQVIKLKKELEENEFWSMHKLSREKESENHWYKDYIEFYHH